MKRIREIQQTLDKLTSMDEQLEHSEEWNHVAQDIIQKLGIVKKECERCTSVNLLTPPNSTSSGSLHSDNSADSDNIYAEAVEAYDQQIYSRCVRLIESANRDSPVDMCLISLAHHSYSEMITAAGSSDDAMKFARWWAEFLDSVEAGRSHNEKIELLDYEAIAYEKIVQLGDGESNEDVDKLIEVVVRNFEMVTLLNRPYHIMSLQRLLRLANILECETSKDYDSQTYNEAKSVMVNGLKNVFRDRKSYLFSNIGQDSKPCDELVQQILELEIIQNDENISSFNTSFTTEFSTPSNIVLRL